MKRVHNKGFTLLELAIVLVIVGLTAGGILLGKDMIRAAEVRSTAQQVDMIDNGIVAFQLKFGCLPGDCTNATSFGFQDDTFIISSDQDQTIPNGLMAFLNPVSSANAFVLAEQMVNIVAAATCYNSSLDTANIAVDSTGPMSNPAGLNQPAPAPAPAGNNCGNSGQEIVVMSANGNGNGSIDLSTNEHFAVGSLLEQAGMIAPFDKVSGLIPVKNSDIHSSVTRQRGVFIPLGATPYESLTLTRNQGLYYIISGTATSGVTGAAATAATPVYIAKALDNIIDNGYAMDGRVVSAPNQRLTEYGLFYLSNQTVTSSPNNYDCIGLRPTDGDPDYNLLNDNKPFCSVQISSVLN